MAEVEKEASKHKENCSLWMDERERQTDRNREATQKFCARSKGGAHSMPKMLLPPSLMVQSIVATVATSAAAAPASPH